MIIESPQLSESFLDQVEKIVGPSYTSSKKLDRLNYARDSWFRETIKAKYAKTNHFADIIVWPANRDQVQSLVKLALLEKIPVVPYGAGSGVCGGVVPVKGGMIIDMKRMNRLIHLDKENGIVEAEAGILSMHLEDQLQRQGFTLGHFPSSIICASLGGCLAARSAGQLSSRYGKIEDMTLEMEVVTGRAEVVQTRNTNNRDGIDLNQIFLGSEGTLCLITKAKLRVYPLPKERIFQAVRMKDMETSIEAMRRFTQTGLKPSVVRLYDELDTFMLLSSKTKDHTHKKEKKKSEGFLAELKELGKFKAVRKALTFPRLLNAASKFIPNGCATVYVLEGEKEMIRREQKILMDICGSLGAEDLGDQPAYHWYQNRYRISYNSSPAFYTGNLIDTIEVAISWNKLNELYEAMVKAVSPHALIMAHLSHVYTDGGSLYFTFLAPLKGVRSGQKVYDKIWNKAMATCNKIGAVISHHHGIGRLKAKFMQEEWGTGGLDLYRRLKEYYDPHAIMNPGKLIQEKEDIAQAS